MSERNDRVTAYDEIRGARIALSQVAQPGDAEVGRAIRQYGPVEALARVRKGAVGTGRRVRLPSPGLQNDLTSYERLGARTVCPGDPEWPTQLDALQDQRPYVLWVRGRADLRYSCLRSVSVVGARAATAYGAHVAGEMSAVLAEQDWTVVSGGAYGIDGAAHRGTLAVGGTTVVVMACGLDAGYPRGHEALFRHIAGHGLLISEWPPGATPTRPGFLVRNRVIAALSRGTVVVEAALRSGALNTARTAAEIHRQVMAVPGPVTSDMSAGCHLMLREQGAVCVTSARDVIDLVGDIGADMASPRRGPIAARDTLDATTSGVLEAVPGSRGAGPSTIGAAVGMDIDTVLRCLGELAAGGFVERCERGWRLTKGARRSAGSPTNRADTVDRGA